VSSQSSRKVAQALDEGNLGSITPMGSCKAQESGNSIYNLIPPEVAAGLDISQGSTLELGFHAESNTLLVSLDGDLSGADAKV
jgi:hypothetical protein